MMTIQELIDTLEDYRDDHGPECEVRFMMQPNWPFEYEVDGVCSAREIAEHRSANEPDEDKEREDWEEEDWEDVLYLVEGKQLGYGDKEAWEVINQ